MATPLQKLRVGIIGAGWPAERHADGYRECKDVAIVAVADLDEARRERFARQYGVSWLYGDYRELLANPEIDAVSITLPNFLHRPATLAALDAHKHVLCEKPPAMTRAEARQMADAAASRGRILAYALQRRFTAPMVDLRAAIQSGKLGDVYHARAVWTRAWGVPKGLDGWFTDPARAGGGALVDIGVHVLDMAWYLLGCPEPLTVSGQVHHRFPDLTQTEDAAFTFIRFAGGASLELAASWVLAQEVDHMGVSLYGTLAGARVDDTDLELYTVGADGSTRTGKTSADRLAGFKGETKNFVAAVRGEAEPCASGEQGVALMAMLEAVYESSQKGREVVLGGAGKATG
jgi:predicted dehydrogenase